MEELFDGFSKAPLNFHIHNMTAVVLGCLACLNLSTYLDIIDNCWRISVA